MHFSLFSRKSGKSDQIYLSLDIGTEFVKAIVFSVVNEKIVIKGVGKIRQPVSAVKSGQVTNIKNVVDSCKTAIEQAMNGIKSFPAQDVIIGIAGELVKSVAITVNYNREEPESKITQQEVIQVFQNIKGPSQLEARNIFINHAGNEEIAVKEVSSSILDSY